MPVFTPHLLPSTHTHPGNVRRRTKQPMGREVLKTLYPHYQWKRFGSQKLCCFLFPCEGDIYAGSLLFKLSSLSWANTPEFLGWAEDAEKCHLVQLTFLPQKSTPISSTELPPFVSIGREHPNRVLTLCLEGIRFGALVAWGWETGKPALIALLSSKLAW